MGIISADTDGTSEFYLYEAYGQPEAVSSIGNPYQFTARRVDTSAGQVLLQYNRHRYYDYYTGRWTTPDPLGIQQALSLISFEYQDGPRFFGYTYPAGQYHDGLNIYSYGGEAPTLNSDPKGLKEKKECTSSFVTWNIMITPEGVNPEDLLTFEALSHLPTSTELADLIFHEITGISHKMFKYLMLCTLKPDCGCKNIWFRTCTWEGYENWLGNCKRKFVECKWDPCVTVKGNCPFSQRCGNFHPVTSSIISECELEINMMYYKGSGHPRSEAYGDYVVASLDDIKSVYDLLGSPGLINPCRIPIIRR